MTQFERKRGLDLSFGVIYNMVMLNPKEVIMNNKTFNVAEAKKHLSEILGRVAHGGERITISKRGKPFAILIPPSESSPEDHLAKTKGWLENDDPFFGLINQIVRHRATHAPRVLKSKKS